LRIVVRAEQGLLTIRTFVLIDAQAAEEIEREGAVRVLAAGGEALRQRHIDVFGFAERLNQSDAAGDREHLLCAQRDVVRPLHVLLQQIRLRGNERERVLEGRAGEEAAMRIEDVVARVPEERRRDARDLDVEQGTVEAFDGIALLDDVADVAFFALRDLVLITDRPARARARDLRRLDLRAGLQDVRLGTRVVVGLIDLHLQRHVEAADEGLAIGEEVLLLVAAQHRLEAEIAPGAEEVAMRGRERDALPDRIVGRLRARGAQTDRAAEREVLPFLDGDHDVAIGNARAGLLRLDLDALENAEAVELALRLE